MCEVKSSILEPPLERENVNISGPMVTRNHDHMTLFMEPEQQRQLINISNGCQRIGDGNKSLILSLLGFPNIFQKFFLLTSKWNQS